MALPSRRHAYNACLAPNVEGLSLFLISPRFLSRHIQCTVVTAKVGESVDRSRFKIQRSQPCMLGIESQGRSLCLIRKGGS